MRHAIVTIVQDEPFFWPIWYEYYLDHFPPWNIYVLYHPLPGESEGGGPGWLRRARDDGVNLVRVRRDRAFDHTWLREQVERFLAFLLGSYATATFAEADEIIALDPAVVPDPNLTRWLARWCGQDRPAARCAGHEVVHRIDHEPDLGVASRPILSRRDWWYPSRIYSKTLTWRVPPRWGNGFHQAYHHDGPVERRVPLELEPEPGLLLLHLHKVDYKAAVARLKRTAARNWNEADTRGKTGLQNRFPHEDQLRAWWYRNIDDPTVAATLVRLPDRLRDII